MTEENNSNGLGLIGFLSGVVAIWAALHMNKTFEFLNSHLPYNLGDWIGWAVVLYGWFVLLILIVAILLLIVAGILKLVD